ncbi:putative Proline dehydrogenase protein, partial [Naja naja]
LLARAEEEQQLLWTELKRRSVWGPLQCTKPP